MTSKAYVVGAGLAGLSAAVELASIGMCVELFEAAPQAGGRCRSYFDPVLNQIIDNGNHLVLSGNRATMTYLDSIGSKLALKKLDEDGIAFVDIRNGLRWTIAPNDGPIPFWIFDSKRRVPGTKVSEYVILAKILQAKPNQRLGDLVSSHGMLWERLLKPFFVGALNTDPKTASSVLAAALIKETFAKGGRAYRARIAHPTLAAAFIDPALEWLSGHGAEIRVGSRVRSLTFSNNRVTGLGLADRSIEASTGEIVILAVPPWIATELIPGLGAPTEFRSIVNAHFQIAPPDNANPMIGIIGGTAEWIFSFPDRISITVSSADHLVDTDRETLARAFWADVAAALDLPPALPPFQIVKERRATFAATPEQVRLRPGTETRWANLMLAGDWTDTGLPATIEGAIRSGQKAAKLALSRQ